MKVFIGWDPREQDAWQVAAHSMRRRASIGLDIQPLMLRQLSGAGLYCRPTGIHQGRLWDGISAAPMATEFALTRFLVPQLAGYRGWALFCDCDFLWRDDVAELFAFADERYAVMVVPHAHRPAEAVKMDGQVQTSYARKNWSSLMLVNCAHLHHAGTLDRVNRWPGLWLHQFRWLPDEAIGFLPESWNWLEGVSAAAPEPCAVHYTRGLPSMPGYERSAFADEWREELHASGKAAPAGRDPAPRRGEPAAHAERGA